MEVTAQGNTAQTNTTSQASASSNAAAKLSSDFETFLRMMTTQLENQDPLNPVEAEDFAVQLATFSGVEQQVRTNQLLESLAGGLGVSGLAQLAGWVGMEARVTAPVSFAGSPVDLALSTEPGADKAELFVFDSNGNEVAREEVPLGQDILTWAGTGANGTPLTEGKYTLELASYSEGELLGVSEVAHYARITEARQGLSGIELVITGETVVASEAVTALRDPAEVGG